jgi:hypothetical protein
VRGTVGRMTPAWGRPRSGHGLWLP